MGLRRCQGDDDRQRPSPRRRVSPAQDGQSVPVGGRPADIADDGLTVAAERVTLAAATLFRSTLAAAAIAAASPFARAGLHRFPRRLPRLAGRLTQEAEPPGGTPWSASFSSASAVNVRDGGYPEREKAGRPGTLEGFAPTLGIGRRKPPAAVLMGFNSAGGLARR